MTLKMTTSRHASSGERKKRIRSYSDLIRGLSLSDSEDTDDIRSFLRDSTKHTIPDYKWADICTTHLEGTSCGRLCYLSREHREWTYQWQKYDSPSWLDMAPDVNHQIEGSYCDPAKDDCQLMQGTINFVTMIISGNDSSSTNVRRLGTPSSCEPSHLGNKYATCWKWYWLDDKNDQWFSYGSKDTRGMQASVTSDDIETQFLKTPKESLDFETKEHKYKLDFERRKQVNLDPEFKTERSIRRRPVFRPLQRSDIDTEFQRTSSGSPDWRTPRGKDRRKRVSLRRSLNSNTPSVPARVSGGYFDSDAEICVAYLEGTCRKNKSCTQYHCEETYQWQEYDSGTQCWLDFGQDENRQIERSYCNPAEDSCNIRRALVVNFTNMTCGQQRGSHHNPIRRVSTPSSCGHEPGVGKSIFRFATRLTREKFATFWVWYWLDQYKQWVSYDLNGATGMRASVGSDDIERQFLKDPDGTMNFKTEEHIYILDFSSMIQKNMDKRYGTEREIRRRPAFSTPKVKQRLHGVQLPDEWDATKVSKTGYELVQVTRSSDEYQEVNDLFSDTMKSYTIKRLQRVQNLELWHKYKTQEKWMKKKIGKQPRQERLFHGTKREHVHAICTQGFDPRVSGSSSGTKYGEGSYFAMDASYSHDYTTGRMLFLARVLVGDSTLGNSGYKRPPAKNRFSTDLYDSCVDDTESPSIFVIFKQEQAYPEFVIEYY